MDRIKIEKYIEWFLQSDPEIQADVLESLITPIIEGDLGEKEKEEILDWIEHIDKIKIK